MRIGVVSTSYPRRPGDFAGAFVAEHVASLRRAGHQVDVIAAGPSHAADGVHRIPAAPGLFYAGGAPDAIEYGRHVGDAIAFSARLTARVARTARDWDAVCAHWLAPSGLAAGLATLAPPSRGVGIRSSRRLLVIAHGGDVHLLTRAHLLTPALAFLMARGARLAFVSDALRRHALACLPPRLAAAVDRVAIVQPMGIDLASFQAIARARAGRARASPATIAILARLVPVKGIAVAIEAMSHLQTPARLVIAGDGPLRDELARHAADLRAPVDLVGVLAAPERDALLARADALVIPSMPTPGGRTEGMPVTALEALAAGLPLVVSSTGGLGDLPAEVAWHAPPGDARALAAAIDRALEAGPAPAGAAFAAGHDWDEVSRRLAAHWLS